MSLVENRFLCPHCRQKLACEDGYTGWQIQCPACKGAVIVPLPSVTVTAMPPERPDSGRTSGVKRARPPGWWLKRGLGLVAAAAAGGGVTYAIAQGGCTSSIRIVGIRVRGGELGDFHAIVYGVLVFLALVFAMMDSTSD